MAALEAISSVQVANIAEVIVGEEVKQLRCDEKRLRLLETHDETDPVLHSRLLPGGLFIKSSVVGIPPGMSVIQQTRHVFLRKAGDDFVQRFFDLPNRFELLDTEGTQLLFAAETYEDFYDDNGCLGAGAVRFDVSLLGLRGGGVLSIKADKTGLVTISDFRKTLGTIRDVSGFCCYKNHRSYSICDENHRECFKIRGVKQKGKKELEFGIFDDEMNKIGYLRHTWGVGDEPEHAPLEGILYGVCFPQDMDTNEKVLLVGALFSIYFQHHYQGGHGAARNPRLILFLYIAITFIIIGIFVAIILWLVLGHEHRSGGSSGTKQSPKPKPNEPKGG